MSDNPEENEEPEFSDEDSHRGGPQLATSEGDSGNKAEREDINRWYESVGSRLRALPSSPAHTNTVLDTIKQLHELFEDVQAKRDEHEGSKVRLTFSFDDLYRSLSIKQEGLFKVLVRFQSDELKSVCGVLDQIESSLEEELPTSYSQALEHLHTIKALGLQLESCQSSLQSILDAPQPIASFVQQLVKQIEQESIRLKSQAYRESEAVCSKAQSQQIRCQALEAKRESTIESINESLEHIRGQYIKELSGVEEWLTGVVTLLCQEPVRDEADYSQDHGREPQDPGLGYDSSEDPLLSQSSGGSVEPATLETSVDADLTDDDEYIHQVAGRVISPEPEIPVDGETDLDRVLSTSLSPLHQSSPGLQQQSTAQIQPDASTEHAVSSPLAVGETDLDALDDERLNKQHSTDLDEVMTGTASERSLTSDADTATVIGASSTGSAGTLNERASQQQINTGGVQPESYQPPDSLAHSTGSYDDESGGSDWGDSLELVAMTHDHSLHRHIPSTPPSHSSHTLPSLLSALQEVDDQLDAKDEVIREALSHVQSILSTSDQRQELERRVQWVELVWGQTSQRITERQAQLNFEKQAMAVKSFIMEARKELEAQPGVLLLAEDISLNMKELMDYFEGGSYDAQQQQLLGDLEVTRAAVKSADSAECGEVLERLRQACDIVKDKVVQQKLFLKDCLSQWRVFEEQRGELGDWLDQVDELVARDTFGYNAHEAEQFLNSIKTLKENLSSFEENFSKFFELGSGMLEKMAAGEEPTQYMDDQLSSYEQRWSDLVTQESGIIDQLETAVKKVARDWKAFNEIYDGAQSFISQMTKMVGTEPLESSGGDSTLLTTYKTYQDQLLSFERRYNSLKGYAEELSSNPRVGNREGLQSDFLRLQLLWNPLVDNVSDTLKLLIREYNDWIMMKLQKTASLVSQSESLINQKIQFVENYPVTQLFQQDAAQLLREADELVASQEQLDMYENDCTNIEEDLLQRQVQYEAGASMRQSASSLELPATAQERERLQAQRLKLQTTSDSLQPLINVFYLQLQLLKSVQDGRAMVVRGEECAGEQRVLENMLTDIEVKLSGDFFEGLNTEVYDLGAVSEDCSAMEAIEELKHLKLPSYQQIVDVNQRLGSEVDSLNESSDKVRLRLSLFIQWWSEYHENKSELLPWLEGVQGRLDRLTARAESTQPPLESPAELLVDIKELLSECEEKQVLLSALTSTSDNIVSELSSHGSPPSEVADQVTDIQQRFTSLCQTLTGHMGTWEDQTNRFDSYLSLLTELYSWINEFYSVMYDEVCIRIPAKASDETINRHKKKLEGYKSDVEGHAGDYESVVNGCEVWGDYLVPDETVVNLPSPSEPSPPPFSFDDESSEVPLPYVRKRVSSLSKKWGKVQELIVDREHQLEISGGTVQSFLESLANLNHWIEEQSKLELLVKPPPADSELLNTQIQELQALETAMEEKVPTMESLMETVNSLKNSLSSANASVVDERVTQMQEHWTILETAKDDREKVCKELVPQVQALSSSCDGLEEWVISKEAGLTDCGSISADLNRLKEQSEILKSLDEQMLEKRKEPETLLSEVKAVVKACSPDSSLESRASALEARFLTLSQECVERQELCEEALSTVQEFVKKTDVFLKWVDSVEKSLDDMKKTKKPVGTIQLQLGDFHDFMRDIESHSEEYLCLCPEAQTIISTYQPGTALQELMDSISQRWNKYVNSLEGRCDHLLEVMAQWNSYESQVKALLDWITEEANKLAKKVTTPGDEGVVDHINACNVFTDTMSKKKESVTDIKKLVDELKKQDGFKKNGTSDVDSRWNDVNQHWSSLIKLLEETLLHLEATDAEVRHVTRIRSEEILWLSGAESRAGTKVTTRGEITVIEEEIQTHQDIIDDVTGHQKECEFIEKTIPFLVQHSRKEHREALKTEGLDFIQRYTTLLKSEETYTNNLRESIPLWEEFKQHSQELTEWVQKANDELRSDRVASGNESITKASLNNAQNLLSDTHSKGSDVNTMLGVSEGLKDLVLEEDQEFLVDTVQEISGEHKDVEERTQDLVTLLDDRLKSWQVFPVEEARVVQEFLNDVSNAVDADIEEELSSEELMEKIEQLESLQAVQQSNEQKVSTIEQSVGSDDIKEALKKNPDISKERNNLLQGWSSVSSTLKEKISAMKQKAVVVKELEGLGRGCEAGLRDYQTLLDTPIPPSVVLADSYTDLRLRAESHHNKCQSSLSSLEACLKKHSGNPVIPLPAHISDKAIAFSQQFQQLSTRAVDWASRIESTVTDWALFNEHLSNLTQWCKSAPSEVSSLKAVHSFAKDFMSLEDRLQALTEGFQERVPRFAYLQEHSAKHCTGEEPQVMKISSQFSRIEKCWNSLAESIKLFPELVAPWKKLTSLFDDLSTAFERVDGTVKQELGSGEANNGHLSEHIRRLKDSYEQLQKLTEELNGLHDLEEELLTPQICKKDKAANELKQDCKKLKSNVHALREKLKKQLEVAEEKERRWVKEAQQCIEEAPHLARQLQTSRQAMADLENHRNDLQQLNERMEKESAVKDNKIKALERQLRQRVPQSHSSITLCRVILVIVLLLILFLIVGFSFNISAVESLMRLVKEMIVRSLAKPARVLTI